MTDGSTTGVTDVFGPEAPAFYGPTADSLLPRICVAAYLAGSESVSTAHLAEALQYRPRVAEG